MKRFLMLLITALPVMAQQPKFWTLETKIEAGVLAGELAIDGVTTQKLNPSADLNPFARPLVAHGAAGQAAASAIGFGAVLGTSYLLHKLGHQRASRWVLRLSIAAEGASDVRQVCLVHQLGETGASGAKACGLF